MTRITTIAAAALFAFGIGTAQAGPGLILQGTSFNGWQLNGVEANGRAFNGALLNTFRFNGYRWNGTEGGGAFAPALLGITLPGGGTLSALAD